MLISSDSENLLSTYTYIIFVYPVKSNLKQKRSPLPSSLSSSSSSKSKVWNKNTPYCHLRCRQSDMSSKFLPGLNHLFIADSQKCSAYRNFASANWWEYMMRLSIVIIIFIVWSVWSWKFLPGQSFLFIADSQSWSAWPPCVCLVRFDMKHSVVNIGNFWWPGWSRQFSSIPDQN